MAGALVGGAFLSATLQVLFDRMASRPVLDFFKGQKLDDQLLRKLKIKMITINKVLDDADDKQHTDPVVKQWLDELKDVVYEAEDLLDEIASEVQRSKIEAESQTTLEKMQDFASYHNPFKTGKKEKLEEILGTLEDLVEQMGLLGLSPTGGTGRKPSYQRPPTTSIPDESVIYGRDADKEAIMKWVLHPDRINNLDVLPIVGIGGVGKTTLAQHVYSDNRVRGYFDKMSWICVSEEEFNVVKITKDILQGLTKQSSYTNNPDQLQTELIKVLTETKFLLILDDAWSEDSEKWENLLKPLRLAKKGSKILVTSRSQVVADHVKTSRLTHHLHKLSPNDCWFLFRKHAFAATDMSGPHMDLENIGRQIAEKCHGLPLAAKLLGKALRFEGNPEKWIKLLERDISDVQKDKIHPSLRLSYQFLPSHLKRCFAYCAVFPKDYEFEREKLIRLWMAEGLLSQHKVNKDIEQVGEDCFDDLVSRSFFQKSTATEFDDLDSRSLQKSTVTESFVMHDLLNDLAKSISGEFCFRYGVDGSCEITERIRHLWLCEEADKSIFPIQHLRTIFSWEWPEKEVENLLPTLTRCRVFSCRCRKLTDSIGNLMHLRYLDLSYSSMERLPDTVTSLCNLETLILYDCESLVELPATIFKLINLSLLDIRGTNLRKMPPHMGKLKKLGELDYYIVGKESDCSVKELGPLKRLRGYLRIEKLRNVSQVQEAKEASLKCKEKLKGLELIWNDEGSEDSLHERNVLEQLRPHTNIEQLSISGYAGTRFPDWVGDSSFSNMVELKLKRCRYCTSLPALGQLGSLKRLSIIGFDGIAVVGPEFYGNSNKPPFGCLESLKFKEMLQWQEWVPYSNMDEGDGVTAAFPLLRKLRIVNCPNLKEIQPTHHLPSLTELTIKGCGSLERLLLDSAPALEELEIRDCPNLKEIQPTHHLPSLTELTIEGCGSLERLLLDWAPALRYLTIEDCPNLKEIQPTHHLPSLTQLTIKGCGSLERLLLDSAPALQYLTIRGCPNLKEIQATHHLPSLTGLEIDGCGSLERLLLDSAPALENLEIRGCPNLKEIQPTYLPSLTDLKIRGGDQLVSLPRAPALQALHIGDDSLDVELGYRNSSRSPLEMVEQLMASALKRLVVRGWDSVTCFPLDLFPMLESLEISDCSKLESLSAASQAQPLQRCTDLRLSGCLNSKRLPKCMASLFPSLTTLRIKDCPESTVVDLLRIFPNLSELGLGSCCEEVESFPPEKMLLPPTLTSLEIENFPNVRSFDNTAFQSLKRLTDLQISDCPKLQSIPEEGLFYSLDIWGCPLLQRDGD